MTPTDLVRPLHWAVLIAGRFGAAPPRTLAASIDLCRHDGLRILAEERIGLLSRLLPARGDTFIGWGRRPSGRRSTAAAQASGGRAVLLEDGFLRSYARDDRPVSLVFDDVGIYYDAAARSRIEAMIGVELGPDEVERARCIVAEWRREGLSKYNAAPDYAGPLPRSYVLVVDQVRGDLSVAGGLADATTFQRMLKAAREENPGTAIVVKLHPETAAGRQQGYFDADALRGDPAVTVIAEDCHPARLLAGAGAVYTVTSQMGFEALIHDRPVRCFGMPFYAGWGLTRDELPTPSHRGMASLEQLVHAALVGYPRYIDYENRQETEVEAAMREIGLQRRHRQRGTIHALGMSRWKRPFLRRFLAGSKVRFVRDAKHISDGATVAVWGAKSFGQLPATARVLRIEDGFLRSSGLGADLVPPLSLAIDDIGIYFDATQPSRLETILETDALDDVVSARAARLVDAIRENGLTKYNLAQPRWARPSGAEHVILVPGQVESDASIHFGAPGVRTNLDLLKAARATHPEAWIVYKPHPDVVAGLRRPGRDENRAAEIASEVVTAADTAAMLGEVDEVHTITSLLGFEALIRGIPVTCHGIPFYAGWGLTEDRCACPRRTRHLTLHQLVAGTLIEYPTYVSRRTGRFITPEEAVEELSLLRASGSAMPTRTRGVYRTLIRLWRASGLERKA